MAGAVGAVRGGTPGSGSMFGTPGGGGALQARKTSWSGLIVANWSLLGPGVAHWRVVFIVCNA